MTEDGIMDNRWDYSRNGTEIKEVALSKDKCKTE